MTVANPFTMRVKVLTTTSDRSKCEMLERSLQLFNYDYHIIEHPWEPRGFLNKLIETYRYVKTIRTEYTHFLYTDAWDTLAQDSLPSFEIEGTDAPEFLISAEMNCYPYPNLESQYPTNPSRWHFVNGGGWFCNIERFIEVFEANAPNDELNDQVWLTNMFLKYKNEPWMKLDYECKIFQTIGFVNPSMYEYREGRYYNIETGTYPLFIHGNGHTPMDECYEQFKSYLEPKIISNRRDVTGL